MNNKQFEYKSMHGSSNGRDSSFEILFNNGEEDFELNINGDSAKRIMENLFCCFGVKGFDDDRQYARYMWSEFHRLFSYSKLSKEDISSTIDMLNSELK